MGTNFIQANITLSALPGFNLLVAIKTNCKQTKHVQYRQSDRYGSWIYFTTRQTVTDRKYALRSVSIRQRSRWLGKAPLIGKIYQKFVQSVQSVRIVNQFAIRHRS